MKKLHTGFYHNIIPTTPVLFADLDLLFMLSLTKPNICLPTMFSSIPQRLKRAIVMKLHTGLLNDIISAKSVSFARHDLTLTYFSCTVESSQIYIFPLH